MCSSKFMRESCGSKIHALYKKNSKERIFFLNLFAILK
ncbi:hypothetical protein LBBP_01641 [Leptospira borgpetersenii serovar Ballum]|uniref:Uncharacterized protein n=1 Tax=Leptospira borgpetersenii serovar Ballum TaxID=280505 RepID=A0A0S2IQN8_LEPBO|nr:hypothetical protein LBBP_01641 [Leptospira borgpetersenii serovar Ballum]